MDPLWLTHEHLVLPARVVETGAVGLGSLRLVRSRTSVSWPLSSGTAQKMPTLGLLVRASDKPVSKRWRTRSGRSVQGSSDEVAGVPTCSAARSSDSGVVLMRGLQPRAS